MMIIVTVDLQSLCHAALNRLRIFYMRHQFYILKDSFLYQVTWIRFGALFHSYLQPKLYKHLSYSAIKHAK